MAYTQAVPLLTPRRILVASLAAVGLITTLILLPQLVENLDAKDIMVIQSPIDGTLNVYTDPGWKWQGFGKVTTYPRRDQFSFSAVVDQGKPVDESISTRFNDGGHGNISGTMNWQMPMKTESIIALHKDFGNVVAIEQQLIRTSMQKVIYNVGPTMSSTESSAEKRPEIPKYIDDQLVNGPYLTKTVQVTQKDAISGQDKQVAVVQIALNDKGQPMRESKSQISEYGIVLQPVAINQIKYDPVVEKQITERQNATTQVQISIANAKKAEQEAITTAKQGEANAAKAKWEQETLNAKDIALAEKNVSVATLGAKAAEQYKREQILRGEGDAQAKALRMNADGALDTKLEAYVAVNKAYADAIKTAQPGAWTPAVVMGSGSGANGGAQALMDMFAAKTARELGIDMSVTKGNTAKK
jgi:hypothetical protein